LVGSSVWVKSHVPTIELRRFSSLTELASSAAAGDVFHASATPAAAAAPPAPTIIRRRLIPSLSIFDPPLISLALKNRSLERAAERRAGS
jgi:hypothetical protein